MSLSVRVIQTLREFYQVRGEWNALLDAAPRPNIFLTVEWLGSWWSVFGRGNQLYLLLAYDKDQLVGGVPFYLTRRKMKKILSVRELRFVGTGGLVCPDHLTGLVAPGYEEAVIQKVKDFLVSIQHEWDTMMLRDIDVEDPFCRRLGEELKGSGRALIEKRLGEVAPYVQLDGQGWDTYVASLKDSMQKNIRRRRTKLNREFQTTFVKAGNPSTLEQDMQNFMELHGKRRISIGSADKFSFEAYRLFHSRLAQELAGRGRLHLSFLELNGKRVAVQYGFEYQGRLFAYQTGFDPAYKQSGVFQILMGYILEDCCKRGIREVDLLRGGENYKYDWTQGIREVGRVLILGTTFRGRLLTWLQRLVHFPSTVRSFLKKMNPKSRWFQRDLFKVFVMDSRNNRAKGVRTVVGGGIEYRWLDAGDRATLSEIARLKETNDVDKFGVRWKRGHRCFGAFVNGKLIHTTWVSPNEWCVWENSRRFPLRENEAFFYDAMTQAEYRGKGIALKAFEEFCNRLAEEGIRYLYCVINVQNETSLRTYRRIGICETGQRILSFRIKGMTIFERLFEAKKEISHSLPNILTRPQLNRSGVRILTTYPIPQSPHWQKETTLLKPRSEEKRGLLGHWGFRDWTLAFRLLKARRKYDVLITGCEREDGFFAILQSLLPGKRIPHLMTCCLWKSETNPLRKWWKGMVLRWIARSVRLFLVWSRQECDTYSAYFKIPREKFVFMPHHASLDGYDVEGKNGNYIFAGGDSSRDYETLLEAVRSLSFPTLIVAKQVAFWNGKPLPPHVTAQTTDPLGFRKLMAGARMVVLPLTRGLLQSTGQQSYLNAMALKKPVIVSEVPGVLDHVTPEVTGIVVPPGDPVALREAILRVMGGGSEVQKMVEKAYERVQNEFSLTHFVNRILSLAEKVSQHEK
ncbi:MAG: GNAT family N-acetyltransferase [Candidatus Omnitrophica bacterium]|nr:GNAT family N-acetyltransferase [Candidatus Omnitrophota bacterium]